MSHRFVLRSTTDGGDVVEHSFAGTDLPEVLVHIEQFLRGTGFVFDGELDIVQEDATPTVDPSAQNWDGETDWA